MDGKVVAISGASSGIGLETARGLGAMGARIIAIVRDRAKAEAALAGIPHDIVTADLFSLADVRMAGAEIRRRFPRLDVLINNAGAIHWSYGVTVDGFERTFALNHLAVFQLTYELKDLLAASAPARVVTVSSNGHRFASFRWDDLATRWTGGAASYSTSKLCNIWFAREAGRKMASKNVTSVALHPGSVASGFAQQEGSRVIKAIVPLIKPFLKTVEQGAQTSIFVASSPTVEGASGLYYANEKPKKPTRWARDDHEAQRLWELSEKLCGVTWA
jgi:NAD(P)-dependent dehydrogenase (short-subunit alcohol dehydrogenase family)